MPRTMGRERIGVGIVGASVNRGWASIAHVPALGALDDFEIRAVSTTRMESASATAQRLGVALAFDNHLALVAHPEIDLVVVVVRVPEHHRVVCDALSAGKMVFCEWPLARNLAEAQDLASRAASRGLKTVVGLQGAVHPAIRHLADLVQGGAIGRPVSTSLRLHPTEAMWTGRFDPPFAYMAQAASGATMLSIAAGHALAPLARVLGGFKSVSAVVANQRGDGVRLSDGTALAKDTPDEVAAVGVLQGGAVASLHVSAGRPAGRLITWEIQGIDGSLLVESAAAGYLHVGEISITLQRRGEPPHPLTLPAQNSSAGDALAGPAAGVARLYAQLVEDLRTGDPTVPDFAAAVATHRVLDAIERASVTGARQDLRQLHRQHAR